MAEEQPAFRAPQVKDIVGTSYRQLDYWDRTALVRPSIREAGGSGTQRLYSFQDMLVLRVIKKLLEAGGGPQQIRKAIDHPRESQPPLPEGTLISAGQPLYPSQSPLA